MDVSARSELAEQSQRLACRRRGSTTRPRSQRRDEKTNVPAERSPTVAQRDARPALVIAAFLLSFRRCSVPSLPRCFGFETALGDGVLLGAQRTGDHEEKGCEERTLPCHGQSDPCFQRNETAETVMAYRSPMMATSPLSSPPRKEPESPSGISRSTSSATRPSVLSCLPANGGANESDHRVGRLHRDLPQVGARHLVGPKLDRAPCTGCGGELTSSNIDRDPERDGGSSRGIAGCCLRTITFLYRGCRRRLDSAPLYTRAGLDQRTCTDGVVRSAKTNPSRSTISPVVIAISVVNIGPA